MNNFVKSLQVALRYKEDRRYYSNPKGLQDIPIYRSDVSHFFENFILEREGTFFPDLLMLKVANGLCTYGESTVFWIYPNSKEGGAFILFIGETTLYHAPTESLSKLGKLIFDPKCQCFYIALDKRFKLGMYQDDIQGFRFSFLIDEDAAPEEKIVSHFPENMQPSWQEIRDIIWMKRKSESKRKWHKTRRPSTAA